MNKTHALIVFAVGVLMAMCSRPSVSAQSWNPQQLRMEERQAVALEKIAAVLERFDRRTRPQ